MGLLDRFFGPPSKDKFGTMFLQGIQRAGEKRKLVYDPMNRTEVTRRGWLIAALMAIAWTMSSRPAAFAWAEPPRARPVAIRGEIVLPRASHDWMSQQVEEPCILPNPKAPGRLIM